MHQLSPHSTIAQLEVGGLLGNGVVVVEDSEGSLVLLQLRAGTSLPTSTQRLEAAGHRHDLCLLQERYPVIPRGSPTRFLHLYWLGHHHGILTVAPHWPGAVLAPVTGGRAPAHWWGLTCAVVSGPACPPAQG